MIWSDFVCVKDDYKYVLWNIKSLLLKFSCLPFQIVYFWYFGMEMITVWSLLVICWVGCGMRFELLELMIYCLKSHSFLHLFLLADQLSLSYIQMQIKNISVKPGMH